MDSEPSSLWEEDMSTLLAGNQPLRETLGTVFDCGDEASQIFIHSYYIPTYHLQQLSCSRIWKSRAWCIYIPKILMIIDELCAECRLWGVVWFHSPPGGETERESGPPALGRGGLTGREAPAAGEGVVRQGRGDSQPLLRGGRRTGRRSEDPQSSLKSGAARGGPLPRRSQEQYTTNHLGQS